MQGTDALIVAGSFGSGDSCQQRHRGCDDRERDENAGDHQRVVLDAWCLERLPELRMEEERGSEQACAGGQHDADEQRHGGLEADDAPQGGKRNPGETKETEGPSSLGEPAGDADGEAAAGNRQTGEEDDIRELLIAIDLSRTA